MLHLWDDHEKRPDLESLIGKRKTREEGSVRSGAGNKFDGANESKNEDFQEQRKKPKFKDIHHLNERPLLKLKRKEKNIPEESLKTSQSTLPSTISTEEIEGEEIRFAIGEECDGDDGYVSEDVL
jgi:hypothetical protein